MKITKLQLGLFSALMALSNASLAETGSLVTLTESGAAITPTDIEICLNAQDSNNPLNCQTYTVTQATFLVTPVNTGQDYAYAGVKVPQGSGFTFNTVGSNCTQGSGDYCLFSMSSANPRTINMSSNTVAVGEPRDGGVVACLFSENCTAAADGGSMYCTPKNLIASSADNGENVKWSGNISTAVGGDAQDFDDGAENTDAIVKDDDTANKAATICDSLTEGGHTDWYLPARNELGCLYNNRTVIGGFAPAFYWSSTEYAPPPAGYAWSQFFFNGGQFGNHKNLNLGVRCVRAFTP